MRGRLAVRTVNRTVGRWQNVQIGPVSQYHSCLLYSLHRTSAAAERPPGLDEILVRLHAFDAPDAPVTASVAVTNDVTTRSRLALNHTAFMKHWMAGLPAAVNVTAADAVAKIG